ncbi:MAG: LLM class flavin-dependent oxidoreductase [Anaerolineae bacterium]|nr:LLM class flavin-dependent oxidoreductase [Anaerolineae bacterium]
MKYAVFVPPFGPYADARALARLAREAEDVGWDGFFIWDHIAGERYPKAIGDPWVALTAIALNTRRLKIGTMVTPIPRRRPQKLARETVTLDHLSGGRLILGVGLGGIGHGEWDDLGDEGDLPTRGEMLDEGLDVLTGLWKAEHFSYSGKHYTIRDAAFEPAPCQKPRIPIWVAGVWPAKRPFRRAARWDGAFPGGNITAAELKEIAAYIEAQREGPHPARYDIVYRGVTKGGNSQEDADLIGGYRDAGMTWWLESVSPFNYDWDGKNGKPFPVDAMYERVIQGPPGAPTGGSDLDSDEPLSFSGESGDLYESGDGMF